MKSWVESANDPATDFPIQNLPLCCFPRTHDGHTHAHLAMAIGDQALDVTTLAEAGYFDEGERKPEELFFSDWRAVALKPGMLASVRRKVQGFLRADAGGGQQVRRLRQKALVPLAEAGLIRPVFVMNYTDFYASVHHATTVGSMFRPDNPLLPNYKHVPIGYHGRASSVVMSGSPVKRPVGQQSPPDDAPGAGPSFGPCKLLDYELEVGCLIGRGNPLGESISVGEAREHMLGLCLVNDWSARDMQKWEYQPLGPFLAKNFATSMSPFVVTMEALEPFRVPGPERGPGDPAPLPYLTDERDQREGGFEITLEVWLRSAEMKSRGVPAIRLSTGSFRRMFWTFSQMIAHHTSNGCNLAPGDLLASGTVSGPEPTSRGCLLELTWDGLDANGKPKPRKPIELPTGEKRTFLADGDEVTLRGFCEREGFRRIGFGECVGTIAPARQ